MLINIFSSTSGNISNNLDTSSFVQKPFLGPNYIEKSIEEIVDTKNQLIVKNLTEPDNSQKSAWKMYVDISFYDPCILKITTHVDFNDKDLNNVRFVEINNLNAVREHVTPKLYYDQSINKSVLGRKKWLS